MYVGNYNLKRYSFNDCILGNYGEKKSKNVENENSEIDILEYNDIKLKKVCDENRLITILNNHTLIYYSPGNRNIELNCVVDDYKGEKIRCILLAYNYLVQESMYHKSGNKILQNGICIKPGIHMTEEAIKNNYELYNNIYDAYGIKYTAESYYIVTFDNFGICLKNIFMSYVLNVDVNRGIYLILRSENHGMALTLRIKTNPSRYVITFYNPNETAVHKRIVLSNLQDIDLLSINDIMSLEEINEVFPQMKTFMFEVYPLPNYVPQIREAYLQKSIFYDFSNNDISENLYYALSFNNVSDVQKFTNSILNDLDLSEQEKVDILLYKTHDGFSGFYVAFTDGLSDIVSQFTNLVLASKLTSNNKVKILQAECQITGLSVAFEMCCVNTIFEFTRLILNSTLDRFQKVQILQTNLLDVNRLAVAFNRGQTDICIGFTAIILNSNLEKDDKLNILFPNYGAYSLSIPFQRGNLKLVKLFTDVVLNSTLPQNDKMHIILANNIYKYIQSPSIIDSDYISTANEFTNLILNAELSEQDKLKILLNKSNNGTYSKYLTFLIYIR